MTAQPLVYVIDDDPIMQNSLKMLLESVAIDTRTYSSADEFLRHIETSSTDGAVVLLDVRMPGMSGMTLLERLRTDYPSLPVIMLTGHGDVDMAVRAMKLGAKDFITKPFGAQVLLDRIQQVVLRSPEVGTQYLSAEKAAARLAILTAREREIFDRIAAGDANKLIALDLGISVRTVESHRANIMEKLQARTLVDLVLISVSLNRQQS